MMLVVAVAGMATDAAAQTVAPEQTSAGIGTAAGFETRNLGLLLERLEAWQSAPDFVIGPVNPLGFMMKPSPTETLEALKTTRIPVLAKVLRAGGLCTLEAGAAFARAHGATGLAPDLVDLDDVAGELRRLVATAVEPAPR